MCAKYYENPTMLSKVTAKNVGDVFFETHCTTNKVNSTSFITDLKHFNLPKTNYNNTEWF